LVPIASNAWAFQSFQSTLHPNAINNNVVVYDVSREPIDTRASFSPNEYIDYRYANENQVMNADVQSSHIRRNENDSRWREAQTNSFHDPPTPMNDDDQARTLAAGLGTGALTLLSGHPIGAVALGFSAAFYAQHGTKGDLVSDASRAVGDVALSAKQKAIEVNEQHHVVEKSIVAVEQAWELAKELDRQHHIVEKARDIAVYGTTATVDFVREHKLVERSAKGLVQGLGWITEKVVAGSLSAGEDFPYKQKRPKSLPHSSLPHESRVYKRIPIRPKRQPSQHQHHQQKLS
jgi:hypothetical protein